MKATSPMHCNIGSLAPSDLIPFIYPLSRPPSSFTFFSFPLPTVPLLLLPCLKLLSTPSFPPSPIHPSIPPFPPSPASRGGGIERRQVSQYCPLWYSSPKRTADSYVLASFQLARTSHCNPGQRLTVDDKNHRAFCSLMRPPFLYGVTMKREATSPRPDDPHSGGKSLKGIA